MTDALADILWTPSLDAIENLIREGISPDKIRRVGNIMIDFLEMFREKIQIYAVFREFGLNPGNYGLVTLHRPSNVDVPEVLMALCGILTRIITKIPFIFPIYPRTRKNLEWAELMPSLTGTKGLLLLEPVSYTRFMKLVFNCRFTITDSRGIQEETTYLGISCLTMRLNTERPITINQGTNQLCPQENLEDRVESIFSGRIDYGTTPELWDGQTAGRVVNSIKRLLSG